ncbi:MAG: hypothetical protein KJO55_02405, partial [Gammaproteobacteria bacterium]|nr:hypothetical protein [Gammaproteobacteria bacterium]
MRASTWIFCLIAVVAASAHAEVRTTVLPKLDRQQLLTEDAAAPAGQPLRVAIDYPIGTTTPERLARQADGGYRWSQRYHV